jgi:ribonuclease HI
MKRLVVSFDGACEPNPGGLATYGWVLAQRDTGEVVAQGKGIALRGAAATNNLAEWVALGRGLLWIWKQGPQCEELLIRGDSQLVIRQLTGQWGCRTEHLRLLRDYCLGVLAKLRSRGIAWSAEWVRRVRNRRADTLAAEARQVVNGRPHRRRRQ